MTVRVLTNSDLKAVGMDLAVKCMEDAFCQHAEGTLVAPGRISSNLDVGQLVFTVGATKGQQPVVGFRCYDLHQLHSPKRDELTAVFSAADGSLLGLVIGPLLGAIRTGAIGGTAIKYLARRDAGTLGLIGAGYQAQTQLAAALAV